MPTPQKLLLSLLIAFSVPAWADLSPAPKVAATQAALRDLWVEHVFWVRNVVVATLAGNKDQAAASEAEVVANAKQLAGAIEPFYGKAGSDKLFELLAGHWGAVKAHLTATAKGDAKGQEAAVKQINANLSSLADFLASANPNLPKTAVEPLLLAHGAHHVAQNGQLKAKKYADEAKTWGAMRMHMEAIADALGDAIAKQFPEKFGEKTASAGTPAPAPAHMH
jgi:hypothetical protein